MGSSNEVAVYVWNRFKAKVPGQLKVALKYRVPLHAYWLRREDPRQWPLPQNCGKPGLEKYEYSLFSQNGEDGILRFIFREIGFESRRFVEFGFEGKENNSLRLVLKEGFTGVFIDGSEEAVGQFNRSARAAGLTDARAVEAFLNLDNLEKIIRANCGSTSIDLLSIDVDGNDFWFWERLECVSPRVVVIEYNASFGPDRSLSVPYDASFDRTSFHKTGFYHGASLMALTRLGRRKGYSLVGCDSSGVNAFFVRNDCLPTSLPVVASGSAFRPHLSRGLRGFTPEEQFEIVRAMPLVEIS